MFLTSVFPRFLIFCGSSSNSDKNRTSHFSYCHNYSSETAFELSLAIGWRSKAWNCVYWFPRLHRHAMEEQDLKSNQYIEQLITRY